MIFDRMVENGPLKRTRYRFMLQVEAYGSEKPIHLQLDIVEVEERNSTRARKWKLTKKWSRIYSNAIEENMLPPQDLVDNVLRDVKGILSYSPPENVICF
jgi:hypothetical protein